MRFTEDLEPEEIVALRERLKNELRMMDVPVVVPEVADDIKTVYRISVDRTKSRSEKLRHLDESMTYFVKNHLANLALITGVNITDNELNHMTEDVMLRVQTLCNINNLTLPVSDGERDNLRMRIIAAIDDTSYDGGITRTQIRTRIGRNHTRYISEVDDILAELVESGKYVLKHDRYVIVSSSKTSTRSVKVRRGPKTKRDTLG